MTNPRDRFLPKSRVATSLSQNTSIAADPITRRVLRMALAVLVLTSVHHAYGAYIYSTPWRLHVVFVSVLTAAVLMGSLLVLRRWSLSVAGEIAFWVFSAVVLVIPVAAIGLFEGGYNHAVKDALYFAGALPALMRRLFPPPAYELPNDVFFEVTGVLQFILGVATGRRLYSLIQNRRLRRAGEDRGSAAA
jgi:hypothetical protein